MDLKTYTDLHTQIGLAKSIGAAPSFLNQWVNGRRPVPAAFCVAIEKATSGVVTRKELCKDWRRYWPELESEAA